MLAWQALCALLLGSLLRQGQTSLAPAPATYRSFKECGTASTRVIVCFPGRPEQATCAYSIIENYVESDFAPNAQQFECPRAPLFGNECSSIPGTLYIAYGPCNSNDAVPPASPDNSLPVSEWLDILGINSITALGGLVARGYAYQPLYDVRGVTFLPELLSFKDPTREQLNTAGYFQVSISGMPMPALPKVEVIAGGLSILNSPDENFTAIFTSLSEVSHGISIYGCNRLTSLAGFENLLEGSSLSNLKVINDLILSDISALSEFFKCNPDGSTSLEPQLVVGIFGMHPVPLQSQNRGCSLNTVGQACEYISSGGKCPSGTEYIRFADGTIQRVTDDPAPAPGPVYAPAASPLRAVGGSQLPSAKSPAPSAP